MNTTSKELRDWAKANGRGDVVDQIDETTSIPRSLEPHIPSFVFGRGHRPKRVRIKASQAIKIEDLMNTTERAYADALESKRAAGDILRWDFEPERLRLSFATTGSKGSKPAFYTPDFRIIFPDGRIAFDEVKGHWEEAAKVRIRMAADLHPYIFRIVRRKGRAWSIEEVKGTGGR